MMTLHLTFAALDTGKLGLDDKLIVSNHAAGQSGSRLGLVGGETITVEEAIIGVATASANDAAVLLAERLAGSEKQFAVLMTDAANELGMVNSRFSNASGLPNGGQMTTARDMALLGSLLVQRYPQYFHYFSNPSLLFKDARRRATNSLLGSYPGADGIKTGFTCDAGYNIVASAERNGRRLVAVVLGAEDGRERSRRVKSLLDQGFDKPVDEGLAFDSLQPNDSNPAMPSVRLSPTQCWAASALTKPPLPGWGVLLGVYAKREQGVAIARRARNKLAGVVHIPHLAVLRRNFNQRSSWKILLVGLSRERAGRACRHLHQQNIECLVQSPRLMIRRGYIHR